MEKELQQNTMIITMNAEHLKAKDDFLSAQSNYLNLKRMEENYFPDTKSYERDFDIITDEENGGCIIMYGYRFFPSYILKKCDPATYMERLHGYALKEFARDKTTDEKYCQLLRDIEEAENDLHECKMTLVHFGYTFD